MEIDGEIRRWNLENDVDFYAFRAQEGDVLTVDIDYGYGSGESVDTIVGVYTVGVSSYPRYFTNGGATRSSYYLDEGDYSLIIDGITPSELQISIEIKPGNDGVAPVNPKSRGKIPVALLGSSELDVRDVDPSTLSFGATGYEGSLHKCSKRGEDVNDDGYLDLVCRFFDQKAGFSKGDVEGYLRGQTTDGTPFAGGAWLKVVPEKAHD